MQHADWARPVRPKVSPQRRDVSLRHGGGTRREKMPSLITVDYDQRYLRLYEGMTEKAGQIGFVVHMTRAGDLQSRPSFQEGPTPHQMLARNAVTKDVCVYGVRRIRPKMADASTHGSAMALLASLGVPSLPFRRWAMSSQNSWTSRGVANWSRGTLQLPLLASGR